MIKRSFDIFLSTFFLILFSPLLIIFSTFIFLQDFKNPIYFSKRIGKNGKIFTMIKLRSMIINADKSGVDSTASDDQRITRIGVFVRKFKLDELTQLINVLSGQMSLVGPRPNIKRETDLYTKDEKRLLDVKPGITDFSSIVFADEGNILFNSKNPDITYNQLIRPGKSRLGLFYIEKNNFIIDFMILFLTFISIINRNIALKGLSLLLNYLNAPEIIITIAGRKTKLVPMPPPGAKKIVESR